MDSKNNTNDNASFIADVMNFAGNIACPFTEGCSTLLEAGFVFFIVFISIFVVIFLVALICVTVERVLLGKKKSLPKIKDIKPDSIHFHVVSKKKIIKILCIDVLLILGLIAVWSFKIIPPITPNILYLLAAIIFIGTLSLIISCDMHATITADENKLYICYDYLFYKKKVKEIKLKRIKKIMIIDDKIKIITDFRHTLLTVEQDSDAYACFLRLKRDLNV